MKNKGIKRKAIFFDRDGVIIEDVNLLICIEQVCFCKDVIRALQMLNSKGYLMFVITNQPVIARGLATEQEVISINNYIGQNLLQKSNVQIEKFYYCPHHPEATLPQYRVNCQCRKPKAGMLLQAAEEYDLELSDSYMIGDRISDIIAGKKAGCTAILVKTARYDEKPIVSDAMDLTVKPDYECSSLLEAAEVILVGK